MFHATHLLPVTGLALACLLISCDESTSHRLAREREAQAKLDQAAAALPKTALEAALAPVTENQRLLLYCAADLRDPTQLAQLIILEDTVPALGNGLILRHLDAAGDAGLQLTQLQAAKKAKPAILIAHPLEGRLTSAILQDITTAGTLVLGLDVSVEPAKGATTAYVDDRKAGALAAQHIITALQRKAADSAASGATVKGRVVQILADEANSLSQNISQGLTEALRSQPGIQIVHEAPAFWSKQGAAARIDEALRLQGQFDIVVAHTDEIAEGVSEAVSAAGKREDTLILSIGGLRGPGGGVEQLRNSLIDAVIYRPLPMESLYQTLVQAAADPTYRPNGEKHELEPILLTPKNLEEALQGRSP
jgi:ABC-type sugar transport system substrate-binding protein